MNRIFLGGTELEIHVIHLYLLHPMTEGENLASGSFPQPHNGQ
jgi:hypothetical protein